MKGDNTLTAVNDRPQPSDPSRRMSDAPEDEWVIVGSCWGTTFLRRSELKEFQRGNRDFIVWGICIVALMFLAGLLFL